MTIKPTENLILPSVGHRHNKVVKNIFFTHDRYFITIFVTKNTNESSLEVSNDNSSNDLGNQLVKALPDTPHKHITSNGNEQV